MRAERSRGFRIGRVSPLSGQERAGAAAGSCPAVLVDAGCAEGRGCLGDPWLLGPELTPGVALCRHHRRGLTDVPETFGCAGAVPPGWQLPCGSPPVPTLVWGQPRAPTTLSCLGGSRFWGARGRLPCRRGLTAPRMVTNKVGH